MSFMKAAVLGLLVSMMVLSWPSPLAAAPVPVRFVEGAAHGFLPLRTLNSVLVAPGEVVQVVRGGRGREPHGVPLQGRVGARRDGGVHPAARSYHAELPPGAARARIHGGHRDLAGARHREVPREDQGPQGREGVSVGSIVTIEAATRLTAP